MYVRVLPSLKKTTTKKKKAFINVFQTINFATVTHSASIAFLMLYIDYINTFPKRYLYANPLEPVIQTIHYIRVHTVSNNDYR